MPSDQATLPQPTTGKAATSGELVPGRIVGLAAVLRLLVVWRAAVHNPHDWLFHRGVELGILAANLRAGLGFSSPFGGSTGPTALLAPGYPAVVAVIFRFFGSFTFAAEIVVMVMQTLFCCLTVLAIMRIADRLSGARTANVAGAIWAVGIPLLWMPTLSWETSLSALLLAGVIALALRSADAPTLGQWIALGAISGGTLLINPALLLAMVAAIGWAAFAQRRRQPMRYAPLLAIALMLLIVTPWVIRNARVLHAFVPVRSSFGYELWNGNQDGATGVVEKSLNPAYNQEEFRRYATLGEMAFMREKTQLAKLWIASHPRMFVEYTTKRVWLFWSGTGHPSGERASPLVALYFALTTLGGFAGLILLWSRQRRAAALFSLLLLLFPLPYYVTHADIRYRLVIDPVLTVLAAYALTRGGEPDAGREQQAT